MFGRAPAHLQQPLAGLVPGIRVVLLALEGARRVVLYQVVAAVEVGVDLLADGLAIRTELQHHIDLAIGVGIRAVGEPSADPSKKRMKAERLFIGEREYDLYPNRD